jgi:cytochrome d ubiquinol oxidase subunit I
MVGIGLLMVLAGLTGLVLRWRSRLYDLPLFLRAMTAMGPAGFIAIVAGWITTEVGRQPWLVYGLMRTAEGRSPIAAPAVAGSLAAFLVVYVLVFGAGILYLLRLMTAPPDAGQPPPQAPVVAVAAPGTAAEAGAESEPPVAQQPAAARKRQP